MEAALLVVLLLVAGVFILPVVALSRSAADRRRARAEFDALRERLTESERRAEDLERRLSAWVAYFQKAVAAAPSAAETSTTPAAPAETPVVATPAEPRAPEPTPSRYRETRARHAEAAAPAPTDPLPAPTDPLPAPTDPLPAPTDPLPAPASFDWERLVGVRLFAWLGGGALFLAAALFLHYSIQQNLIAPPVRVAIGLGVGALALWGGDRLREKARMAGEALSGAGVAILYAALFAARVLYGLIDTPMAFGGMTLVTVTAGFIAVRRDAYFVALLGLLGGMATPYLLSSGQDRPLVLFLYVALLATGIVLAARLRRWPSLALIGLASSLIVFVGWSQKYLVPERVPYALGAVALVTALFAFARVGATGAAGSAEHDGPAEGGEEPNQLSRQLARLLPSLAALIPLATALWLAATTELAVDPRLLAGYLLLVSAGTLFVGERQASPSLPVLAAVLSVLALAARVGPDLFPLRRTLALSSFAVVPAGYFGVWLWRRGKANEVAFRAATIVTLLGALPVVFHVAGTQSHAEPIGVTLAYVWLHAAGLVCVGALTRRGSLFGAAQALTFVSLAGFALEAENRLSEFLGPMIAGGLVFWALPLAGRRFRSDAAAWWSSAAALPLHFLLLYLLARTEWGGGPLGAVAALCAALAAVSLREAPRHSASTPEASLLWRALFGGLTLSFVTASVPLLLANEWLTISWAAEVLALAWLRRRVPHGGLVLAGALLAAGVAVRLFANSALWVYHERTATPIFNFYLYTFGAPVLFFLSAAHLLRGDALANRYRYPALLSVVAVGLLFELMNVEIADYYSLGPTLTFRLSGGGLAEDMTYSLAWGTFAIGLLVVGMLVKSRPTRIGALVVLVLTVAKVFLHDLWELGSLYRVGSIVGLAVALLGVSFLTQRFVLPKESR